MLRAHSAEMLGILAVSVALAAAAPATVFWIAQVQSGVGEQTESATDDGARERAGRKPGRLTQDERDRLEAENALREEVGRRIESLRDSQGDAVGEDVSFEELRAEALRELNIAASALGSPSDREERGHDASGEEQFTREQHLVCFRTDGSVTDRRDECAENQSGFFGFADEEEEQDDSGAWRGEEQWHGKEQWQGTPQWHGEEQRGFTMPSDDDMAQRMRQRFVPHAAPPAAGMGGMPGGFRPDMTPILAMMDKMIAKLPQVIAIFEEAGIPIAPEAREASRKGTALYQELRGECGNGTIEACLRMQEVGTILEGGMRPPMEKAIMESGQWQIGMQIEKLMTEGMEDMMMMRPGGGGYPGGGGFPGGPPSGYGPPPGYEGMMNPGGGY